MPTTTSKTLASRGCEAAKKFLEHRGYEILESEWNCPAGTIDIIARDGDAIVFADVKTRSGAQKGFPEERYGTAARKKFENIALSYFTQNPPDEFTVRFDALALVVMGDRALVRHHVNALSLY